MNPITGTGISISPMADSLASATTSKATADFKSFMLESLQQVNSMQVSADQAVQELFTGGDVNAAEVLTAVQKADMSFRMLTQIRNKLVQAFQEIKEIKI